MRETQTKKLNWREFLTGAMRLSSSEPISRLEGINQLGISVCPSSKMTTFTITEVQGRTVTVRCTGAAKLNTKPEEVDTKGFISTEIAHTQTDSTAESSV